MNLSLDNLKSFTLGVLKGTFLNKKNLDKVAESDDGVLTYDSVKYAKDEDLEKANDRISKLNFAQKVNESGENKYFFATGGNTSPTVAANVSCLSNFTYPETNAEGYISIEDNLLKLKKGFLYKITVDILSSIDGVAYAIVDKNITTEAWTGQTTYYGNMGYLSKSSMGKTSAFAIINTQDGDKELKVIFSSSVQIWPHHSYISVEVLNPMTVDPVEHVTSDPRISDTPIGHIISYMGNTPPEHYLFCDGSELEIEKYHYLADHFEEEFGSKNYFGGDGETTFALPDLRGEFLRGTGTNSHENSGSGADVGTHQTATMIPNMGYNGNAGDIWTQTQGYSATDKNIYIKNSDSALKTDAFGTTGSYFRKSGTFNTGDKVSHYSTRPTNTSVMYCIKYEPTYCLQVNTSLENNYSYEEQQIGYWVDGKKLYQKTIYIGKLSNQNKRTEYSHNISNINNVINTTGLAIKNDEEITLPLPYSWTDSNSLIGLYGTKTKIIIATGTDRSSFNAYVTLTYTKTTD